MRFLQRKIIPDQKGAFFAITAILAGSLLAAIFFLGINTFIVRRANLELRRTADSICRELIQSPPALSYDKVLQFQKIINKLPDFYPSGKIKLKEAKLIMPTMPDPDDVFSLFPTVFKDTYESYLRNDLNAPKFQNLAGINFEDLDSDLRCSNPLIEIGNDTFSCKLQTLLNFPNTPDSKYPAHLWNNFDNAGNTLGCELSAEVEVFGLNLPFFSNLDSKQEISTRTVVQSKIRGDFSGYLPYSQEVPNQQADAPGLTLAISTHLQTDSDNIKFRFPVNNDEFSWWDSLGSKLNPLHEYNSGSGPIAPAFTGNSTSRSYTDINGTTHTVSAFRSIDDEQKQTQMLSACINPLILARNLFVQTIAELASRNGQLRSSTEILHIGTQSRDISDTISLPSVRAQPTLITKFGEDLTQDVFQLPYIFFNTGTTGTTPSEFQGLSPDGPMNIFGNPDHSTVAAQLRNCFHIYNSAASGTAVELRRINDKLFNYIFEDNLTPDSTYRFPTTLVNASYTSWDQDAPWISTGVVPTNRKGAATILSALGSTQSCPYPFNKNNGITCVKPSSPFNDLRPDLLGLLMYLQGDIPANQTPGIFPNVAPPSQSLLSTVNIKTPVIIVTHQPITESESEAIALYLNNNSTYWKDRHITVVFFSANPDDSVDELCDAFSCGNEYENNNLVVFSPRTPDNLAIYYDPDDNLNYLRYWMNLINPNGSEYIVYKAISVYKSKMTDLWKF